jgi:hypothetical protein
MPGSAVQHRPSPTQAARDNLCDNTPACLMTLDCLVLKIWRKAVPAEDAAQCDALAILSLSRRRQSTAAFSRTVLAATLLGRTVASSRDYSV